MKKIISGMVLLFGILFSLSSLSATGIGFKMEGLGNNADALKAFNKVVAINGGKIDNNAKTDISSIANFGEYQASMYTEEKGGGVSVRIVISRMQADLLHFVVTGGKNLEMDIAKKIGESMKSEGYKLLGEKE